MRLQLDTLPVFAVVDGRGMPVRPVFFADVQAAENACAEMQRSRPGLDITPFGLGMALQAQAQGRGELVASSADLDAASKAGFDGGTFPLFTCQELRSDRTGGTPTLPLFVSLSDAQDALAELTAEAEVEVVSLQAAVEKAVTAITEDGAPAFRFIAPTASVIRISAELNF